MAAPIEWREKLSRHFAPSALRSARLAERDDVLFRLALGRTGDALAIARKVRAELSTYAASTWRHERNLPASAYERHALAHKVLRLNGGEVLSTRTLRLIFKPMAGSATAKQSKDQAINP